MNAEFMDIFGFIGFVILLLLGIRILKSTDQSIRKYGVIIIVISVIGIIVDGYIVLTNFILN